MWVSLVPACLSLMSGHSLELTAPHRAGFANIFSDKLAAPTQGSPGSSHKPYASLCHINIYIYT